MQLHTSGKHWICIIHNLLVVLVVVVVIKWRAKYRTDWAEIFTEDSPSTLVMQISCIARFVQSLVCSTRKSTSDTTIFTIIALSLLFKSQKRVSGGFLGRWNSIETFKIGQKCLVRCKRGSRHEKWNSRSRGFNSRTSNEHVRLVEWQLVLKGC